MKRWIFSAMLAALCIAAVSSMAFADIGGSHHDMKAWGAATADTCYPCHGIKETSAGISSLGRVGSLCFLRCHASDAGVAGAIRLDTAWPEKGVFDNAVGQNNIKYAAGNVWPGYAGATVQQKYEGHRFLKSALPSPDTTAAMEATGWPYVAEARMECTTCHDVHSNQYTPFLRAPMSDNATRANAFCHRCHSATGDGAARWVDMYAANPNGAHPSEVGWGPGQGARAGTRLGRTIAFKDTVAGDNNAVFRNVSPSGATLNDAARFYNPGGKLGDFGQSGNVGCYTCHATHMPAAAAMSQLIVTGWRTGGTGGLGQNDMCVGCHGAAATDGRNPGATAYFHPANGEVRPVNISDLTAAVYQVTTGTFNIVVNVDNTELGAGGRIVCSSCHGSTAPGSLRGVHAGPAGTMLINPAKPDCGSCHNTPVRQAGNSPNSHHVYGGNVNYTAAGQGSYPATITYRAGSTANLSDGLSCEDCHIFNGTAHNWN